MTMNIYTRTGDRGETGLFGGGRVPKDDRASRPTATSTSSTPPSASPAPSS
jgi:cob(I)alamin adenosyltransferase